MQWVPNDKCVVGSDTLQRRVDETAKQRHEQSVATIRAMTDQIAALVWERDELRKQVQRYEKHGVTCQTYQHRITSTCSECNVHEDYTSRPQREWVGLTDEDKNDCLVSADPCECLAKPESHQLMEDVESKLRGKNT